MTNQLDALLSILTDTDRTLRKRLPKVGAEIPHLVVVLAPSGDTLLRGNIDPADLKKLAEHLNELAVEGLRQPDDREPIN